jgi:hypothetical protein
MMLFAHASNDNQVFMDALKKIFPIRVRSRDYPAFVTGVGRLPSVLRCDVTRGAQMNQTAREFR